MLNHHHSHGVAEPRLLRTIADPILPDFILMLLSCPYQPIFRINGFAIAEVPKQPLLILHLC